MTWDIPLSSSSGAVSSVFGRTGAVVAVAGDYFGVVPAALTGATSGTVRLAGALNVNGPPVAGTFQVGDMVMDPSATLWVCTTAGTPGSWSPTVSQNFASRSATATLTLNELTVFSGSSAAQILTLPSSSVHGTMNQIVNTATVSVTISGGASSLSNYGVNGNITLQANQSVQIASNGSGGWFVVSSPVIPIGFEYAYAQNTGDVSITAVSQATANNVCTTSSVTYSGSETLWIQVGTAAAFRGTNWIRGVIYEDSAAIADVFYDPIGTVPATGAYRRAPSAGAHTYSFRAYVDAGTGTIAAVGYGPSYIRVTKAA